MTLLAMAVKEERRTCEITNRLLGEKAGTKRHETVQEGIRKLREIGTVKVELGCRFKGN
jgi:hypothetical protein